MNYKEKINLSHQTKVKLLLGLALLVTFQHSYYVMEFFTKSLLGSISNAATVIFFDLMMFVCLDLIGNNSVSAQRKFLGWIVFALIAVITGILNVFYLIDNSTLEHDLLSKFLSFVIGVTNPIAIVFLGQVYSESSNNIAHIKARIEAKTERAQSPVSVAKTNRDEKIIALFKAGTSLREIERTTSVRRPTINTILKKNGLKA